ncbi:MAG: aminopeptidase N [Desulfobacteraceae bacterium 4572_19]|nr:MAG: aminopeptidase N [Desulfobacteraceae bacterium 4572_19]
MTSPSVKYLKDYTPPPYFVDTIDLHVELYEEFSEITSFMKIRRNQNSKAKNNLILDGKEIELISIFADDALLMPSEFQITDEHLTIEQVPDFFTLEIKVKIKPQNNTALEGLYKSGTMFCTQCEAEGFRKITYFPDRPDVMSKYSCTIVADKSQYPVLLSNGNLIESGLTVNNRHWAKWEDPFKKPCYLFALVAGDLVCIKDNFITCSNQKIALYIYVEKINADKCGHAMKSLKKAMKWDEDVYGRQYDLNTYMIVAVNDFNAGAMENKGLNIFNAKYVIAVTETATDTDFDNIENVIAHEYFHNWTGNRITLKNWFQLSLKEGLTVYRDQEFSADMISKAVQRISDVKRLREAQFPEDAGPMAHSVVPSSYIEMDNFYTSTVYDKGAEVIRMLFTILGRKIFFKGMDLYFQKFDGKAVTTDNFIETMEDAFHEINGKKQDLTQFKLWYTQSGTPVVEINLSYDLQTKVCSLTLNQYFKTGYPRKKELYEKQPMHIPIAVGLLDKNGADLPLILDGEKTAPVFTKILNLTCKEQTFNFINIPEKPIPSLLRDFSAPIHIKFDYSNNELIFLMANDNDKFNKWDAGNKLFLYILLHLVKTGSKIKNESLEIQDENAKIKSFNFPNLSSKFYNALHKILTDNSLGNSSGKSFTALIFLIPSEAEIANYMDVIDIETIHYARQFLIKAIAQKFEKIFLKIYRENNGIKFNSQRDEKACRKLKNMALFYLSKCESNQYTNLAYKQFKNATNMTDELSALAILSNTICKENEKSLELFYEKWKHDPLVLDKWFAIQGLSILPKTVDKVKKLIDHPDFSMKNPNRIRALINTFCTENPHQFHDISGKGYQLLADCTILLNNSNPQMASRLASLFNKWKKYDKKRSNMMKEQIYRIKNNPKLSKAVYEIVTNALL